MQYKKIEPEKLKNYFYDIFKTCYDFYPIVEYSDKCYRIRSRYNNKEIKFTAPMTYFQFAMPVLALKWKKRYLSKVKNIPESDVEYLLDFNDNMIEIHKRIRKSLTGENGKLKFFDIAVILKTVNFIITDTLDKLKYLSYIYSTPQVNFTNLVTINSSVNYSIGDYEDEAKITLMFQ